MLIVVINDRVFNCTKYTEITKMKMKMIKGGSICELAIKIKKWEPGNEAN